MDIRGYPTGPIRARAAFTSDFDLCFPGITEHEIVDMVEAERPAMDTRPGMRHKYMPLRYDRARSVHQVGGRYLFTTWDAAVSYERFTTGLAFEPGVPFWERPYFANVDRHVWRVIGAHDFTPLATTHHLSRLQRWTYSGRDVAPVLDHVWPMIREDAFRKELASVWLLLQPEERQVGLLSVRGIPVRDRTAERIARACLEHPLATGGSLLPGGLQARKIFDRTSVILSMWLPESRRAGGAASSHPLAPLHPAPHEHLTAAVAADPS